MSGDRESGSASAARWEHFEHGADVGVRGCGSTLASAFEQAALALTAVAVDPAELRPSVEVRIECEAPDSEILLVDWLNRLVYEGSVKGLLFGSFDVQLEGGRLRASAWGEPVDRVRHEPTVEVKGATFTALSVRNTSDRGWVAECVVDV